MKINASELAQITGGELSGDHSLYVTSIMTDSRSSGAGHDALFIALRGPNHDGHGFIGQLFRRGIRLFLVDTLPADSEIMTGVAFVKVDDTLEALHRLAGWRRNEFRGKVIAVTGSAGKTIVKEWLAETLGAVKNVIRSPRSYNSQVGVALSLMNIDNRFDVAVIEAGISRPGEMEKLARIIKPDTVVVTNIGDAHGENFMSREAIAAEKLRLAEGAKMLIYNSDDELIKREIALRYPGIPAYTWSVSGSDASLRVDIAELKGDGQALRCNSRDSVFEAAIPFADRASAENAVSVIACCLTEGIPAEQIKGALADITKGMPVQKL